MADSRSSTWAYWGRVLLALGIGIAGVAGGCVLKNWIATFGDEPPIRVKNGSMHFDLDTGTWNEDARCTDGDGRKCWTPDTGESQGVFAFVIDPMPVGCEPPAGSMIDKVTVTYSDGKRVSLKAGARKAGNAKRLATKIRPHALLARDARNSRRLSYGAAGTGYVAGIELDGDDARGWPDRWTCRFTPELPLMEACFTSTGLVDKCKPPTSAP